MHINFNKKKKLSQLRMFERCQATFPIDATVNKSISVPYTKVGQSFFIGASTTS